MAVLTRNEDVMPYSRAFRARPGFLAPMFWATKADMDCI